MQEHLRGRTRSCPVCGEKQWDFSDIVAPSILEPAPQVPDMLYGGLRPNLGLASRATGGYTVTTRRFAIAVLTCTTCFYVMHFAWKPIQGAHGK